MDRFEEHLTGFEERRKQTEKLHAENVRRLKEITHTLEGQNEKLDAQHKMLERQNERSAEFEKKVDDRFDPESEKYILKEVVPFIQAKVGLNLLLRWLVGLAAGSVAYMQIKGFFKL